MKEGSVKGITTAFPFNAIAMEINWTTNKVFLQGYSALHPRVTSFIDLEIQPGGIQFSDGTSVLVERIEQGLLWPVRVILTTENARYEWDNVRANQLLLMTTRTPTFDNIFSGHSLRLAKIIHLSSETFSFESTLQRLQAVLLECIDQDDPERFGRWAHELGTFLQLKKRSE